MNFQQDLKNGSLIGMAMSLVARTTNAAGSSVDLQGGELQHSAVLVAGAVTDGTHTVKLQESTDGTNNWADIEGASFSGFTSGAAQRVVQTINFKRGTRFVRATATVASATSGGVYGVLLIAQKKTTGGDPQLT
ncbi:hypothetical protein [Tuwongella immobilis]|uniref:Uncharacterized protein n=1 Tax=Tuwongella immobilis TaxID=692036 RepID=A0A6C2YR58_9BACT|nr:hypothetical protein [Tuwongella immobilis]VIP03966.1 Uncharacterized protein OS=Pseudomonas phage PPpW-3 PE=4 SV=1 [Tuwongella immobilis]VTS05299.1 Uncharacterized protein OS=Pseudomonas phage PPpW-3 PE=4 SV=1 [Tuwongella immobilis]